MTVEQYNDYALNHVRNVSSDSLLEYVADCGISTSTALKYLAEAKLYNRTLKKHFIALAMPNEDEGIEFFNSVTTGYVGGTERDISFIRGLQVKPANVHVFFSMKDFLAVVSREPKEALRDDAIILHSLSLLHKVSPYLYQYDYQRLYSWMENNPAGSEASTQLSAFCAAEPGLQHQPQQCLYAPYETACEWCRRERPLPK